MPFPERYTNKQQIRLCDLLFFSNPVISVAANQHMVIPYLF